MVGGGRRVAEEERSDGCRGGSTGDRGVLWWMEAWAAWCGFFLTGWSLLWADPLPAGSYVSWMCAGWGRVEEARYKEELWSWKCHVEESILSTHWLNLASTRAYSLGGIWIQLAKLGQFHHHSVSSGSIGNSMASHRLVIPETHLLPGSS